MGVMVMDGDPPAGIPTWPWLGKVMPMTPLNVPGGNTAVHAGEDGLSFRVNELRKMPRPARDGGKNALVPRLHAVT